MAGMPQSSVIGFTLHSNYTIDLPNFRMTTVANTLVDDKLMILSSFCNSYTTSTHFRKHITDVLKWLKY